ncbi:MAG: hypothetical protein J5924_02250 [Bacteroidaceae bacterium]|nr:hypothetical protein [Bacteroidaceae bacterium]
MKKKLQFLFSMVALMLVATVAKAQIYIETDLTSQFADLTKPANWTNINGGAAGEAPDWAFPAVEVNGLGKKAPCEFYYWSCSSVDGGKPYTGDVFYQTVTGLASGTYKIELYGAAAFTFDRDFGSTAFTGDLSVDTSTEYKAGDKIDPSETVSTGVSLYAQAEGVTYGGEIPIYYATSFPNGATIVTLDGVVVGESGTIKIGMNKTTTSTNWHVVQLKSVIATVNAEELLASSITQAQNALKDAAYASVTGEERTALSTAVSENSAPEATADAYKAAIKAISDATTAFLNAAAGGYKTFEDVKAAIDLTAWPYASATKKAAVEDAMAASATSADDAIAKATALTKAYRQFVESNALAEGVKGAVDMTDKITNPIAAEAVATPWTVVKGEGSGGGIDVKDGEPWTDGNESTNHKYFDGGDWGKEAWDVSLEQEITLDPGKYMLTAIARASGDVAFSLYAGETKVTIPAIGATGGVFNRGWNDQFVEFEVEQAGAVKIGVQGVTDKQYNWMSFSNFRLVQLEAAPTTYAITISGGIENGTVEATPATAAEGEIVTLTITPADGYELDELTVMAGETPVTVAEGYTFEMPASAVTVSATFKEKAVEPETALIKNADFSESTPLDNHLCGYGKDMEKNGTTYYGLQDVEGWNKYVISGDNTTAAYPNSGMGGGVFAYGSSYELKGNNKVAPTAGPDGGEGQALGFFGVWGTGGYYYQDVTLPAGSYTLIVPIYNASGTQPNETQTGFFVNNSDVKYTVAINPTVGQWTTQSVEFTLTEETAGQIRVGYKSTGSGSAANPMIFIDQVKLKTALEGALELYEVAMTAANDAAKETIVTGEEMTSLNEAIAANSNIDKTSIDAIKEATTALNNAATTVNTAKASYQQLADTKAMVDFDAWPYASAEKKVAVEDAMNTTATSAEDATAKTAAIAKAYRQFVESNALAEGVEGAVNMTDKIVNPTAEEDIASPWIVVKGEGSGGALGVKKDEPWTDGSDNSTHKYFDGGDWNAQSWDVSLEQEITLEAGKYLLTAIARASGDVAFSLYAGETKVTIPAIGATGGVFNRGWNDQFVEFEVTEAGAIKIGVQGVVQEHVHNWMSFSNFRLVQLEAAPVPKIVLNAPTFNAEEGTQAEPNMLPEGSTLKINYTAENLEANGLTADDVKVKVTVMVSGDLPEAGMSMGSTTAHRVMGETFYIPLGETDFPVALKEGYVYQNIVVMGAALVKPATDTEEEETLAAYVGDPVQLHWVGIYDDLLIEIAQDQGKSLDEFPRTEFVEGDDYNTYTCTEGIQVAFKMFDIDVKDCDYVIVKFAEPVAAGWELAFWAHNDQSTVAVPAGATEYKYVFADDTKCAIQNGILPQICMLRLWSGTPPLEAKVTGVYKHYLGNEVAQEINVERYPGMGYTATEATVDFALAKRFLGVKEVTSDMLRIVNPDNTEISDCAQYDGWFNAEGVAEAWNASTTKVCAKFFQAIPNGTFEICDMNGADEVGKTYSVKWALVANDKKVVYTINVTFVEKPAIALTFDDLNVVDEKAADFSFKLGTSYQSEKATVDVAAILDKLEVESLSDVTIYAVQSDGSLDDNYKLGTTDGWRNAAGDWQGWGADAFFYVKANFAATENQLYEVGTMDPTQNTTIEAGTFTAKYAFVKGNDTHDAVVLSVNVALVDPVGINSIEIAKAKGNGKYLDKKGHIIIVNDNKAFSLNGIETE